MPTNPTNKILAGEGMLSGSVKKCQHEEIQCARCDKVATPVQFHEERKVWMASKEFGECRHKKVKCIICGEEGTLSLFYDERKGPLSPEEVESRRQRGKRGGWKEGKRRVDGLTILEAAAILADGPEAARVIYRGVEFAWVDAIADGYAAKHGDKPRLTITGATKYIRDKMEQLGKGQPKEAWRNKSRKVNGLDLKTAATLLVDTTKVGNIIYRGHAFSREEAAVFAKERGTGMSSLTIHSATQYIRAMLAEAKEVGKQGDPHR